MIKDNYFQHFLLTKLFEIATLRGQLSSTQ